MNETKALKLLGIPESEANNLTVVKISRAFARAKQEIDDSEEFDELYEAFEYAKENLVGNKGKSIDSFNFPDDMYSKLQLVEEKPKFVGAVLVVSVEGTPTPMAFAKSGGTNVFIKVPKKVRNQDNIVFTYDKESYEGKVIVKDVTREQYEEMKNHA